MFDDTITLHVEYYDNGVGGVIPESADAARLYTEDGTFVAVWKAVQERVGDVGWITFDVTTSDVMDDEARDSLSGYRDVALAVNAGVEWFRANGGVPKGCTVELS